MWDCHHHPQRTCSSAMAAPAVHHCGGDVNISVAGSLVSGPPVCWKKSCSSSSSPSGSACLPGSCSSGRKSSSVVQLGTAVDEGARRSV